MLYLSYFHTLLVCFYSKLYVNVRYYLFRFLILVGKGTSIILKSNLKSLRTKKQGRAEDPKSNIVICIHTRIHEITILTS